MLASDIRSLYESYQNIYEENDGISFEMIGEIVEELVEECVEYGYTLDEAADTVQEAAIEYLMELNPYAPAGSKEARAYQKSTTSTKRGEERKAAVKGAVERVKAKAKGAKAAAGIAGSIAKDEARRAGRAAKQAVTSTAQKTKEKVKSGVKGLLGKGLRAAASAAGSVAQKARKAGAAAGRAAERLGEEFDVFDLVLEFLQAEGYAETLEEAEWMMANLIDEEAVEIILEASCEEDEEDEKEMKKGKKSKKEEDEDEDDEELDEALTGDRYKKVMKKPGGTAYSRKVSADPSKRATRGGRGGESDFGAGDRGSGNRAARRAGTYQEEEFAIDEGAAGDVASRAQKLANQRKGQTPERKKMYQGLADKAAARERGPFKGGTSRQGMTPSERTRSREAAAYQADVHGGSATYGKGSLPKGKKLERQRARGVSEKFELWLDEAMSSYDKNRKRAAQRAAARNAARDAGKTGAVPGVGYVTPRREKETYTDSAGVERHKSGARMPKNDK